MRHRAALATIYEHEIASATRRIVSCRATSRGSEPSSIQCDATRSAAPIKYCLPIFAFHVASNARYKEFRSLKWTVWRSSLKLCARFLVVADNFQVLQAHFLKKVMELPSLTPYAKYCTHPNASLVTYILLRRKFSAKFS